MMRLVVSAAVLAASCSAQDSGMARAGSAAVIGDVTEEKSMIKRLDALVTFLSGDVDSDAIRSWLTHASLRGEVAVYPEGYDVAGKPYLVYLELPTLLPLAALENAFGPFQQGSTDRGMPREAAFAPGDSPGPFRIVLSAEVDGPGELRGTSTKRITLRRDPK